MLISVVVPVHNEEQNVVPLLREIETALRPDPQGEPLCTYEIIFVDDCSPDTTLDVLKQAKTEFPALRVLAHSNNCGQSSAIRSGIFAAKGELIVTLDGDGQNDPADIPKLLSYYRSLGATERLGMVGGRRVKRQDSRIKRLASRLANKIRQSLLNDHADDVGCGLKLMPRAAFLRLPYFDHMHRFLPALFIREGLEVHFVDVNHRPRVHGTSNYGVFDRLWVSISDLRGVMWLNKRRRLSQSTTEY